MSGHIGSEGLHVEKASMVGSGWKVPMYGTSRVMKYLFRDATHMYACLRNSGELAGYRRLRMRRAMVVGG